MERKKRKTKNKDKAIAKEKIIINGGGVNIKKTSGRGDDEDTEKKEIR